MGSRLIGWETEVGSHVYNVIDTLSDLGYPTDPSGGDYDDPDWYCHNCETFLGSPYCDCDNPDVQDESGGSGDSGGTLHPYHCECGFCDAYEHRSNFFHFQEDCTVDGEIISKPVPWDSPATDTAIRDLSYALITNGSITHGAVGNHVHVDIRDMNTEQLALLWQMYLLYQDDYFEPIARGAHRSVRGYNHPLVDIPVYKDKDGHTATRRQGYYTTDVAEPLGITFTQADYKTFKSDSAFFYDFDGSWMVHHGNTAEFRLWNASRSPFRIRLYTAISAALVEAAYEEADPRAGWENNVLARLTTKQQNIYDYHAHMEKPALPECTSDPRPFWEPLNERRCTEAQAVKYRFGGYDVYDINEIRSLVLS
jgi:hypothetical protein